MDCPYCCSSNRGFVVATFVTFITLLFSRGLPRVVFLLLTRYCLTTPNCCLAAATTLSTVKPNFLSNSFNGAEAPKVFMPKRTPSAPVKRSHPKVEACSTETRAVTLGGITLLRYYSLCGSKISHDGRLITRALMPSFCTCSEPSPQRETSL